MRTALQLPALISCSAMRHGMENGVSLMGGMRMMKSMFAVPQGSNHFFSTAIKMAQQGGKPEYQTVRDLFWYFLSCPSRIGEDPLDYSINSETHKINFSVELLTS